MTLWWGLGLSLEAGARVYMAWTWKVERVLLVAPFISYGVMGALLDDLAVPAPDAPCRQAALAAS